MLFMSSKDPTGNLLANAFNVFQGPDDTLQSRRLMLLTSSKDEGYSAAGINLFL